MADTGGLELRRLGGRPGSLGSYAGKQLGIPVITVELPAGLKRKSPEELFGRFGPMLVQAIIWPARVPHKDVENGPAVGNGDVKYEPAQYDSRALHRTGSMRSPRGMLP